MVRIPYIKIPSVRVGGIDPTSDIGTAIGGVQPVPITYLTQWKIVGNSEVHTLPYPDGVVLPNGYKRCKYLEFHGTEYIDSGIIPEQGISVNVKCEFDATDLNYSVLGTRDSAWGAESFYLFRHQNSSRFFASYGGKVCDYTTGSPYVAKNTLYNISLNSQSVSFNDFTQAVSSTITKGNNTILIGKVKGYDDGAILVGKIHGGITFGLNNTTIANFIPCLDDNDVPCLYDTISQTTLYNQGTGTFGYELYPQPTEIWSCGEYSAVDNKYHILVQPQGGNVADIALTEPLRKVNSIADKIEFPSNTEGKAVVTRNLGSVILGNVDIINSRSTNSESHVRWNFNNIANLKPASSAQSGINLLCAVLTNTSPDNTYLRINSTIASFISAGILVVYKEELSQSTPEDVRTYFANTEVIYELATPTTELVDAPQIEEADSYSMVISQSAKAVEWSSFTTESDGE